jgi:hypothetical protein
MADLLLPENLDELLAHREGPCISVFLPTRRVTIDGAEERIRLRNLLDRAEGDLIAMGVRRADAVSLLEPGRDLMAGDGFWTQQSDGLALFLAAGWMRSFRLPVSFPELVVVGDGAHVRPLLELLAADGHFYLLALSQNQVRLLSGTRQQVDEVALAAGPKDLADTLAFDDLEKERQFHVTGRGGSGAPVAFHGHGIGAEVDKVLLDRFLREVDTALGAALAGATAPLVLAAVGYVQDRFRLITGYHNVLDRGIEGNPESLSAADLHTRGWSIVEPVFTRDLRDAADRYLEVAGQGRASASSVAEVVSASLQGRVDVLFVPVGEQQWGSVDAQSLEIAQHPDRQPGDEDLLDRAAMQTLAGSGRVFAVPPGEVPGSGPLAAVLRY